MDTLNIVHCRTAAEEDYGPDRTPTCGVLARAVSPLRPVAKVPLPFEIWGQIIQTIHVSPLSSLDWTENDRHSALLACCLVSKAFLHQCRFYLCQSISIRSRQGLKYALTILCGSPAHRSNLEYLTIDVTDDTDQAWISSALVQLSGVPFIKRTLRLTLTGVDLQKLHPNVLRACTLFNVWKLSLLNVHYSRFSHISPFLMSGERTELRDEATEEPTGRHDLGPIHLPSSFSLDIASSWHMLAKVAGSLHVDPQTEAGRIYLRGPPTVVGDTTLRYAREALSNMFKLFDRSLLQFVRLGSENEWRVTLEQPLGMGFPPF